MNIDGRYDKSADGYVMHGVCFNCGEQVTVTFQKGYRVSTMTCPRCGCREVGAWKQSPARQWWSL